MHVSLCDIRTLVIVKRSHIWECNVGGWWVQVELPYKVSRYIVTRWERILASTFMVLSRSFLDEHYHYIDTLADFAETHPDRSFFSYEIHAVAGDSTNTSVALSSKAHIMKVHSLFHHAADQEFGPSPPHLSWTIFPDPLPVPLSCGAIEQRCMFFKQLLAAGVRPWTQQFVLPDNFLHLRVFVWSTDQGGDQKGAEKLMQADALPNSNTLMFRQWCLLHEIALCVKTQLTTLGTYWSMLAKLINVWRTSGNAKRIWSNTQ